MRPINEIIIHCTATRPDWWEGETVDQKVAEIRRWHMDDRGWKDIGYHFLIDRDGKVVHGRALDKVGAHVVGHNTGTIGIALFGGHGSAETDKFADNFTAAQEKALRDLIAELRSDFPTIKKVSGHNEYAAKACPGFNVPKWYLPPVLDAVPRGPGKGKPLNPSEPPSGGFFMRLWRALFGG
jgi:hypothetical protein